MDSASSIKELLDNVRANMGSDLPKAEEMCLHAISVARKQKNISGEGEARHLHAQILYNQGKNGEAITEIKRAIELREKANEPVRVSASLNSLGIFLSEIGDYSGALENSFPSLQIKEELNDKKGIATTLINIGSIYHRLNNREQETKTYERALQIANEIEDKKLLAYCHLNLGLLSSESKKYKEALKFLKGLDEIFISIGDKWNAVRALNNEGMVLIKSGKPQQAIEKCERCLSLAKETQNVSGIVSSLNNLAEAKIDTGKLDEAKVCMDEAIELAEKNSLKIYLRDTKELLSAYFSKKDDYKNSLEEFKKFVAIKDELINSQNLKQLGELQLRYDLDRKEKEAEINQLKNVELKEALDKLQMEKDRSENLLLNILPEEVAEELKTTGSAKAKYFEQVSVMFIDIRNFTIISEQLSPEELVAEIDFIFRGFDEIIMRYNVEKIKTIGDAYMCAGGIPVPDEANAENVLNAAIEILEFMHGEKEKRKKIHKPYFEIRIGVNTGPVVAGIVGSSKFAYDIWGDTVNTAARMEQTGEVGRINVSGNTYKVLKEKFTFEHRGKINAKNKGEIDMYFLEQK